MTMNEKLKKTDAEWREQLTAEEYRIARQKGTEPAFTGKYWDEKGAGTYVCVCCNQALYDSETKFDSGTGWPSFWAPVADDAVESLNDRSLGMERVEVRCKRCGAHLGHLFDDGPNPTGMRHCVNSASLKLVKHDER
jgi:peptide-methionine (R)-S-oxide reductase